MVVVLYYLLYNCKVGRKNVIKKIEKIHKKISKKYDCYKIDLDEIKLKETTFINGCDENDIVILCGGDGTLDQFLNSIRDANVICKMFFYSCGSGNDFARDYKKQKFIDITNLKESLPTVKINNQESYLFVNGVGMGVDAVVCRSKAQYRFSEISKSYFSIALSSLKTFRTYSLDVIIDGEPKHFDDVWFFVCNHGSYIGGGMKITPTAVRDDDFLDICIIHSLKIRTLLLLFPLIFIGKHIIFKKYIYTQKCTKFKAIPDGCNILQRDGEVIDYVKEIEVER